MYGTVASDSSGNFVATWMSNQTGNYEIYARRYDSAGTALSNEFKVNTFATGDQGESHVGMNDSGDFIVTWHDSNAKDGNLYGVYAQQYDSAGTPIGGEVQVATSTTSNQYYPTVAYEGNQAVVVWSGNGTVTGNVDSQGVFIGFRGTATDITEEVEAQARAQHLALHDSLTSLPNRVLFAERLNMALGGRRRKAARVAVLCLDLDHFKEVNDTLGHAAGDLLLNEVAERLKTCARPTDTVARLGGDEFAIIQTDINGPPDVQALTSRIIEVIEEPFQVDGNLLHVGVSIGVALSSNRGDSPEKLLKNADIALYRAKQSGRNTVRFFEVQMDLELQERKALEYDLRQAIAGEEFELHYQPLIDIRGAKITGVEALLRWRHPDRGMVPPELFIPIAEDTGLIGAIGEWVLATVCRQALEWPDLMMAVNMSAVQFRQRDIVQTVRHILQDVGLPPSRLELEITESVLISDTDLALEVLNSFKEIGIKVALDDFGTGFSSLACLNAFPFDKLKIDRSFIADAREEQKSHAIVRSVISLGRSLGIATTAEGVEARDQIKFLLAEGCDQVQGNLFGGAMNARRMTEFLKGWTGFGEEGDSIAAA